MVPVPFEVTFDTRRRLLPCININIPQDFALEGDHNFTVQLSTLSPDVVTIGSPADAEVVITDDESKCVYVWMSCAYDICRKYLHACNCAHIYGCKYDNMIRRL